MSTRKTRTNLSDLHVKIPSEQDALNGYLLNSVIHTNNLVNRKNKYDTTLRAIHGCSSPGAYDVACDRVIIEVFSERVTPSTGRRRAGAARLRRMDRQTGHPAAPGTKRHSAKQ